MKNTGKYAGDEVVQLYIANPGSKKLHAIKSLKGFQRINLQAGESKTVKFTISSDQLTTLMKKQTPSWLSPGNII